VIKIQKVEPAGWKVTENDTIIYFGEYGKFGCYQNEGTIYKDQKAFDVNEGICYIPEYDFDGIKDSEDERYYNFKHPEAIPEEFKYEIIKNPYWSLSGYTRKDLKELCQESNYDIKDLFDHLDWMYPETLINETTEPLNILKISKLCYELYKIDWKHSHNITKDIERDNIKDYYEGLVDSDTEYTYDEYLEEFGYDGQIYVCYEEFCDNEYQDKQYMCELLDNEKLIKLYHEDIERI
jgi:hypothetical protein